MPSVTSRASLKDYHFDGLQKIYYVKTVNSTDINNNNATYYGLAEIVKGWQSWYKEQKNIFDKVQ